MHHAQSVDHEAILSYRQAADHIRQQTKQDLAAYEGPEALRAAKESARQHAEEQLRNRPQFRSLMDATLAQATSAVGAYMSGEERYVGYARPTSVHEGTVFMAGLRKLVRQTPPAATGIKVVTWGVHQPNLAFNIEHIQEDNFDGARPPHGTLFEPIPYTTTFRWNGEDQVVSGSFDPVRAAEEEIRAFMTGNGYPENRLGNKDGGLGTNAGLNFALNPDRPIGVIQTDL
jgi:hypothetical protein